jgi:hypothetical protein
MNRGLKTMTDCEDSMEMRIMRLLEMEQGVSPLLPKDYGVPIEEYPSLAEKYQKEKEGEK